MLRSNSNYHPAKSVARPTPTILFLSFATVLVLPLAALPPPHYTSCCSKWSDALRRLTYHRFHPAISPNDPDTARKLTRSIHRSVHPAVPQLSTRSQFSDRRSLSLSRAFNFIRDRLVEFMRDIIVVGERISINHHFYNLFYLYAYRLKQFRANFYFSLKRRLQHMSRRVL